MPTSKVRHSAYLFLYRQIFVFSFVDLLVYYYVQLLVFDANTRHNSDYILRYPFFISIFRNEVDTFLIAPAPDIPLFHHRHFLPVRFSMQRYSVRSVAKYRCANCIRVLQQPSTNHRFGYSVKSVCCFLVLSDLFPLLVLHKNQPRQEAERASRKGK